MKQVIQNARTGKVSIAEVPSPACRPGNILVRNNSSIISIGTERSIVELGKKSLIGKARARPDLVKRAIEKARTEGITATIQEAKGRLETPTRLGYSCAGIVTQCGLEVTKFSPGDRVACIGSNAANHAEFISVPENLAAIVPANVLIEHAAFGQIAIIALHGIRSAKLSYGSTVAVIGLGLLGLITVQILRAYGFVVIGMDPDQSKCDLATLHGAEFATDNSNQLNSTILGCSDGTGADSVIITATSKTVDPLENAINVTRIGGRIVIVGAIPIQADRQSLWEKEIELIISKAGGPGSLVPEYEENGVDYPTDLVRWTENRNLKEYLRLLSRGLVDITPLITHRFPLNQANEVYDKLSNGSLSNAIAIAFEYQKEVEVNRTIPLKMEQKRVKPTTLTLGVIGAGLFGQSSLLPVLRRISNIKKKTIATLSGISSQKSAEKFGFSTSTTDSEFLLQDKDINGVIIIAPHSVHAELTMRSLECEKHVLVEKPLCTNWEEYSRIESVLSDTGTKHLLLMVGHNRRHSPHTEKIRLALKNRNEPLVVSYRVNAGFVSSDHWVHSTEEGRSRIIGEMSHFVDIMQYLTGADPIRVMAERVQGNNRSTINNDNIVAVFKFSDGSVGQLTYAANGNRSLGRESLEVFWQENTAICLDYKKTRIHTKRGIKRFNTNNREMGYAQEISHFSKVIAGKIEPKTSRHEILITMKTIFAIEQSLATGLPVAISTFKTNDDQI